MRNRTRKTTKTKTPLREGEHGTAERAEAERANSAAGAWAERGPAAFVEAAAGAEGQDALARSVDAFDSCLRKRTGHGRIWTTSSRARCAF